MDRLLEATFRAEREHFWFHGFRRFVRPLVAQALAGRATPRILDCGCGTGHNLSWLGEYGRAYGFDLAMVGVQYARTYGRVEVVRASVTDLPYPTGAFDLVTSFDVLYSLTDEQEQRAAREMRRVLRPGGAAVINVAAFDALRGNHSVLGGELRRYTGARLRAVLEPAGFTVERMTYTNASLFPILLALRTMQRTIGLAELENADREIAIPSWPVNTAMKAVLSLEATAVRHVPMPFGSSLLCLARAKEE